MLADALAVDSPPPIARRIKRRPKCVWERTYLCYVDTYHRQRPLCQASVAERPVVLPPVERSTQMSDPSPGLSYRVRPNGAGWYWEIITSEREVIERGIADTRVRARARAIAATYDRLKDRVGGRHVPILLPSD